MWVLKRNDHELFEETGVLSSIDGLHMSMKPLSDAFSAYFINLEFLDDSNVRLLMNGGDKTMEQLKDYVEDILENDSKYAKSKSLDYNLWQRIVDFMGEGAMLINTQLFADKMESNGIDVKMPVVFKDIQLDFAVFFVSPEGSDTAACATPLVFYRQSDVKGGIYTGSGPIESSDIKAMVKNKTLSIGDIAKQFYPQSMVRIYPSAVFRLNTYLVEPERVFSETLQHELMHVYDFTISVFLDIDRINPDNDDYHFTLMVEKKFPDGLIMRDGQIASKGQLEPEWFSQLFLLLMYYCNNLESRAYLATVKNEYEFVMDKIKDRFFMSSNPRKLAAEIKNLCKTETFSKAIYDVGLLPPWQNTGRLSPEITDRYMIYKIAVGITGAIQEMPAEKLYSHIGDYYVDRSMVHNPDGTWSYKPSPEKMKEMVSAAAKLMERNARRFLRQADKIYAKEVNNFKEYIMNYNNFIR